MFMRKLGTFASSLCLLLVVICGCNQNSKPLGKISGQVTSDGQPLDDGLVSIINLDLGVRVEGEIQPDGTYEITTFEGGVPPGDYSVIVYPPEIPNPNAPPTSEPGLIVKKMDNIPKVYRAPNTTPLKVTVQQGENEYDIELKK